MAAIRIAATAMTASAVHTTVKTMHSRAKRSYMPLSLKVLVDAFISLKSSLLEMLSGVDAEYKNIKDVDHDKSHIEDDMNAKTQDEWKSLFDIDDQEMIKKFHAYCIGFS